MIAAGLTIWGIFILFRRRVAVTGSKIVTGWPAIAIGLLFAGIIPMSVGLGILIGIVCILTGSDAAIITRNAYLWETLFLGTIIVAAIVIATRYGKSEAELALKRHAPAVPPSIAAMPRANDQNPYRPPAG